MPVRGLKKTNGVGENFGPPYLEAPKADVGSLKYRKNELGLTNVAASDIEKEKKKIRRGGRYTEKLEEIKGWFNGLIVDKDVGRFLDIEQMGLCRGHLAVIAKLVREVENLELKDKKGEVGLRRRLGEAREEMKEKAEKFYTEADKLKDDAMAMMKKQEEQNVGLAEKEKKFKEAFDELNKNLGVFFGDTDDSLEKLKEQFGPAKAGEEKVILDESDEDVLKFRGEDADKFIELIGLKEKVAGLGAQGQEIRLIAAWGLDLDKTKEEILAEVKEKIAEILSRKSEQKTEDKKEPAKRKSEGLSLTVENFETMFYAVMLVKTFAFSHPQANGEEVGKFVTESLRKDNIKLSPEQAICLERLLASELKFKKRDNLVQKLKAEVS